MKTPRAKKKEQNWLFVVQPCCVQLTVQISEAPAWWRGGGTDERDCADFAETQSCFCNEVRRRLCAGARARQHCLQRDYHTGTLLALISPLPAFLIFSFCSHSLLLQTWHLKWQFIAPDGFYRGVIFINDQFPGPTIRANVGDAINITVVNHLLDSTVAVHWHGISQHGTPFMDGAAMVTQFPSVPLQSFQYQVRSVPAPSRFSCREGFRAANALDFFLTSYV